MNKQIAAIITFGLAAVIGIVLLFRHQNIVADRERLEYERSRRQELLGCEREGAAARRQGIGVEVNPYPRGTYWINGEEHQRWTKGWIEAGK